MSRKPNIVLITDDQHRWQEKRAAYCAMITQIDDEIGSIFSILEERNLLADTYLLFTTDHGDMMGHHNRGHKGPAYDPGEAQNLYTCPEQSERITRMQNQLIDSMYHAVAPSRMVR